MKLIEIATRRRVTILMFTVAVLLFGFVSLSRLPVNLLPDLSYPTLTVRTAYQGAAPAEIENLLSKPIEEAVGVIRGVRVVRSVSRAGQSDVTLEFVWGTDMDYAALDVREKLEVLQLPLEADRPTLLRFDPSTEPVLRFALSRAEPVVEPAAAGPGAAPTMRRRAPGVLPPAGAGQTEDELKILRRQADEQLKKELEAIQGVAAVKVSGGLEDEVQILVDQYRLAQLNLRIEDVAQRLRAENVNLSGGRLEEGTQQFLVRTINEFESIDQIGDSIIATRDNRPIYLRDIAVVRQGWREREAITRVNGAESVELAVYREGDANVVKVAADVERRLAQIRNNLPSDMQLVKTYDQSVFIQNAISEVVSAAVFGGILAILVLYFFLRNFWTTVIIGVSIPVSVVATFTMMYGGGLTLNIMSLGGIALAIGLLVDNSIVVLENIARKREAGAGILEAARSGTREVSTAVVASTLTTVAVFFPLVFVEGIAGQLFRDQALTVTFALLISLVVALTLIPMLASLGAKVTGRGLRSTTSEAPAVDPGYQPRTRFGTVVQRGRRKVFTGGVSGLVRGFLAVFHAISWLLRIVFAPFVRWFNAGYSRLSDRYPSVLRWALTHRALTLGSALVLLGVSIALVPRLGMELIPQLAQGEFNIEVQLPPGSPLERTDQMIRELQEVADTIPTIVRTYAVAGTGNRLDANPEEAGENSGTLNVVMQPGSGSEAEAAALTTLRAFLEEQPGVQHKFSRPELFSFKTPLEVEVAGYDLDALKRVSDRIAALMEDSERFADVRSSMELGHPEVQIVFDHERAARLGLRVDQIADTVVSQVRGEVATRYTWHDRKIDVLVRASEDQRQSVDLIRRLIVNPASERPVTLAAVADITVAIGPGEIRRIGQERVAVIGANIRYGDLGSAAEEVREIIGQVPLPVGVMVRISGQSDEMQRSFQSLLLALTLAVFLVYLVMASQFESLLHPFVILFSVPLALVGAVFALWLTGSTISIVVFIGLIMLAGIVVNNAIVLVTRINQLREDGLERLDAVVGAGAARLRPIVMTTMTTVLGLLPLAIGLGEGAEMRAPMAITVIGGLLVSTLLTLVVIPVMYTLFDVRKTEADLEAIPAESNA
ncbi:MAG: efflux RND transporter permease subunit [Xanthomonadaceae bacterium]|nr:efflux RND transporter permease subunit [Xanthomonadaceae bacterium]